jgi:hypothetical protein
MFRGTFAKVYSKTVPSPMQQTSPPTASRRHGIHEYVVRRLCLSYNDEDDDDNGGGNRGDEVRGNNSAL